MIAVTDRGHITQTQQYHHMILVISVCIGLQYLYLYLIRECNPSSTRVGIPTLVSSCAARIPTSTINSARHDLALKLMYGVVCADLRESEDFLFILRDFKDLPVEIPVITSIVRKFISGFVHPRRPLEGDVLRVLSGCFSIERILPAPRVHLEYS